MVYIQSSLITLLSSFLLLSNQASARFNAYNHRAVGLDRRQLAERPYNGPPGGQSILTQVTPSPGADVVAITKQSQVVTSYVPQFTLCALPPLAEVLVTPIPTTTTAPYKNFTTSAPSGVGSCTTIYSSTVSTVCATVLTGLADRYTVSKCDQDITFSSNYGFALATAAPTIIYPNGTISSNATTNGTLYAMNATTAALASTITPPPTIQTLTTYFIAPWQQLTSAGPPRDVDLKICATYENGTRECLLEFFEWVTTTTSQVVTTQTVINLTTTIAGPSQLIVETLVANITDAMTTYSLATALQLQYTTELETTSTVSRTGAVLSTGPTVYETRTVLPAS